MHYVRYSVFRLTCLHNGGAVGKFGEKNYTCIMCTPTSDHHFTFKIEHIIIKVLQ